jgi:sulfite reductase beta subunit-like hemoprotein
MAAGEIPDSKRAGLPVDLDRLTAEGDDWLSPGERYALKTHGVCAQAQPGVFMIRCRTGGSVHSRAARELADIADKRGRGWLHLTTRQQIELHHIEARQVTAVLEAVRRAGLTTRSACGHTMRGVTSCPDAGVGLDEPFDCGPDARAVAASVLALCPELDTRMPQRINISFGGCAECRSHARLNDAGFVSVLAADGRPGYELWVGGSLGKSAPALGFKAAEFLGREEVLPAAHALLDVFVSHGDLGQPGKGRLKFLVRRIGTSAFSELFAAAFARARARPWPAPPRVTVPPPASLAAIVSRAPEGSWGSGVRPQRDPGMAMVTVNVPLGDADVADVRLFADLADCYADGRLYLTRQQNVMFRHVPVGVVPAIRARLGAAGLSPEGAAQSADVRACTGGPVCSLALTPAQRVGYRLISHPALARNSGLKVHVSGCPNNCAQHQIADLGFSGAHVTIGGASVLGYQVWLGGDLADGVIGQLAGRVAETDVETITSAVTGVWEAFRHDGETLSATVRRLGIESFRAQLAAVFDGQWEPGAEPGSRQVIGGTP